MSQNTLLPKIRVEIKQLSDRGLKVLLINHWQLFLLTILQALIVVLWLKDCIPLQFAESGLYLFMHPDILLYEYHTWRIHGMGGPNLAISAYPLNLSIYVLRYLLNLPPHIVEGIIFIMTVVIGTSSIYFTMYLFANEIHLIHKKIASLAASIFYFLNPYVLIVIWNRFQLPFIIFYGFMPAIFLLYLKGLLNREIKYILYIMVINLIIAYSFIVFSWLVNYHLLIIFLTFLYILRVNEGKKEIIFAMKYFILFEILWFITNAWWILPEVVMLWLINFRISYASPEYNLFLLRYFSNSIGSSLNVLRLLYYRYLLNLSHLFSFNYMSDFYTIINLLLVIIIYIPLLHKKLSRRVIILGLYIVVIIFSFLSKGILSPFGNINLFLYKNIPLFIVYRIPFEKLGYFVMLSYTFLYGISVSLLIKVITLKSYPSRHQYILSYITFLMIILMTCILPSRPIIDGTVFRNRFFPSFKEEIGYKAILPSYYIRLREILDLDTSTYRILFLPIRRLGGQVSYNWTYGYYGMDVPQRVYKQQVISYILYSSISKETDFFIKELDNAIKENNTQEAKFLIGILNIKYIVIQFDLANRRCPCVYTPQYAESILNKWNFVQPLYEIGRLKIYKVKGSYFLPRILIFKLQTGSACPSSNITIKRLKELKISLRGILFHRKSPCLYKIIIDPEEVKIDNKTKLLIILNEVYHPGWCLSDKYPILPVCTNNFNNLDINHFKVGYANAWLLDTKWLASMGSSDKIVLFIYFFPENYLILGLSISFLFWVVLLIIQIIGRKCGK